MFKPSVQNPTIAGDESFPNVVNAPCSVSYDVQASPDFWLATPTQDIQRLVSTILGNYQSLLFHFVASARQERETGDMQGQRKIVTEPGIKAELTYNMGLEMLRITVYPDSGSSAAPVSAAAYGQADVKVPFVAFPLAGATLTANGQPPTPRYVAPAVNPSPPGWNAAYDTLDPKTPLYFSPGVTPVFSPMDAGSGHKFDATNGIYTPTGQTLSSDPLAVKNVIGSGVLTKPITGKAYWEVELITLPDKVPDDIQILLPRTYRTGADGVTASGSEWDGTGVSMSCYTLDGSGFKYTWPKDLNTFSSPQIGITAGSLLPADLATGTPKTPALYQGFGNTLMQSNDICMVRQSNIRDNIICSVYRRGGYFTQPYGVTGFNMPAAPLSTAWPISTPPHGDLISGTELSPQSFIKEPPPGGSPWIDFVMDWTAPPGYGSGYSEVSSISPSGDVYTGPSQLTAVATWAAGSHGLPSGMAIGYSITQYNNLVNTLSPSPMLGLASGPPDGMRFSPSEQTQCGDFVWSNGCWAYQGSVGGGYFGGARSAFQEVNATYAAEGVWDTSADPLGTLGVALYRTLAGPPVGYPPAELQTRQDNFGDVVGVGSPSVPANNSNTGITWLIRSNSPYLQSVSMYGDEITFNYKLDNYTFISQGILAGVPYAYPITSQAEWSTTVSNSASSTTYTNYPIPVGHGTALIPEPPTWNFWTVTTPAAAGRAIPTILKVDGYFQTYGPVPVIIGDWYLSEAGLAVDPTMTLPLTDAVYDGWGGVGTSLVPSSWWTTLQYSFSGAWADLQAAGRHAPVFGALGGGVGDKVGDGTSPDFAKYTGVDLGDLTVGDRIMIAVDMDQGLVWFGKNGAWYDKDGEVPSSDIAAGHRPTTTIPGGRYFMNALGDPLPPGAAGPSGYFPAVSWMVGPVEMKFHYGAGNSYNPPTGFSFYGKDTISV